MKSGPCKGCNRRRISCHSDCEDYREYKRLLQLEKDYLIAERDKWCPLSVERLKKARKRARYGK